MLVAEGRVGGRVVLLAVRRVLAADLRQGQQGVERRLGARRLGEGPSRHDAGSWNSIATRAAQRMKRSAWPR